MKGRQTWCASQASTAICMSMEQLASSSSTIHLGSSRTIDRHNPIIRDVRRGPTLPPCSSQLPINPKPHSQKARKSSSSKPIDDIHKKKVAKQNDETKRKSSAKSIDIIRRSCVKPADLTTPPGSSRYLLSENGFFDGLPDADQDLALVPVEHGKIQALKVDEPSSSKNETIFRALDSNSAQIPSSKIESLFDKSSSSWRSNSVQTPSRKNESLFQSSNKSSSSDSNSDQVVVLKVSLHCKGCAGKVRKHISRMEGVTSFNIDFAAKKVTVTGNVTPLEVLASISKVKNAQLWSPEKPKSSQPPSIGLN